MKVHKKLLMFFVFSFAFSSHFLIKAGPQEDFKSAYSFVKELINNSKEALQKGTFKITLGNIIEGLPGLALFLPKEVEKFLDGIVFQTPKLEITEDTYRLVWSEALVFGVGTKVSARLYVGPGKNGSKNGMSLSVGLPGQWTLSTLLPKLKADLKQAEEKMIPENLRKQLKKFKLSVDDLAKVIDWFEFGNIGFILSTSFVDPFWGQLYLGANIIHKFGLGGPLKDVTNFFGIDLTKIQYRGVLTPTLGGTESRGVLPGKFNLMPPVNFGIGKWPILHIRTAQTEVRFGLSSAARIPTLKFMGGFEVKLPGQPNYIPFKGFTDLMLLATPPGMEVGFQMDGIIKDMFGLPGINFGNAALSATLSVVKPFIYGFALRGVLDFGPIKSSSLVSVDFVKKQLAIISKTGPLTQKDFVDLVLFVIQMGAKQGLVSVDLEKLKPSFYAAVPPFSIGDSEFYLVPFGAEVFDKRYSFGVKLKGSINIFGLGGSIDGFVTYTGLKSKIALNKILIPNISGVKPWIIISGAGADLQRGNADDGPVGEFELSLSRQLYLLDGFVDIPALGIKSDTKIRIHPTKGLKFDVQHKLGGLFDTRLIMQGKPTSLDSFAIDGYIDQNGLNILGNLLTTEVDKFSTQTRLDMIKASKAVSDWQKKADADIQAWIDSKVAQTQWHIDRLDRWIPDAQAKCKAGDVGKCLSVPIWLAERLGHIAHKEVTLKTVMGEAAKLGVGLASLAAQEGIKAAANTLTISQKLSNFAGNIVKQGLNITEVKLQGTLKDLIKKGKMSQVMVGGTIFGRPFAQGYQIDFTKPEQFPKQILDGLVQVFGPKK
ncbi:hypothetical protein KAH94_03705 [bacterium]|nr:hypothetical protein [bacterium]